MLEGKGIKKAYGNEIIFQNFSFIFPSSCLLLLTGASGTGKTTLLQLLNLNIPFEGELRLDGVDLHRLSAKDQLSYRQLKIGCVYQDSGLIKTISVLDHKHLVEAIKGPTTSPLARKAWEMFKQEVSMAQSVGTLSRGQQQRLAILLACFGDSKLLLLDEPTTGLDYKQRQVIYKLVHALSQDRCVIMSTHADPKEGLAFTHHMHLPQGNSPYPPSFSFLKNQIPIKPKRQRFPLRWLWRLLSRQRKKETFRWQFNMFQSITFTILGVFISLMFVLSKELLTITETMIGGRYQYAKEVNTQTGQLLSSNHGDSIFTAFDFDVKLRTYYDESYFEFLKPYHQFYFFTDGFYRPMKDVHLGLINHFQLLQDQVGLNSTMTLGEDELLLGIQPGHVKLLASILNCFPVIEDINETLGEQSLPIYFSIEVPQWGYQDDRFFFLRAVTLTDEPVWFHSLNDYAQIIYEEHLRLPSKGFEEHYETQPWRVSKTMMVMTKDHDLLLTTWQNNPLFQHYHLQRHPRLGWIVYRSNIPRKLRPVGIADTDGFHFHSSWGYHYYPDHRLSGFAQPVFFHPREVIDPTYLDSIRQMKQPYDWLGVTAPKEVSQGFVLANPSQAIKLKTDASLPRLKDHEIYLSQGLADRWNVVVGDTIHLSLPLYDATLPIGMIGEYENRTLRIQGVLPSSQSYIAHHPWWWEHWLMVQAFVPSQKLIPEAWVIYNDAIPMPNQEVLKPFAEVVASVKEIQGWAILAMTGVGVVIGLPSLVLFFYYLRQSLVDDKKTMNLFIGYGTPMTMIQQWYGVKLTWLIMELVGPTFLVILGFDFVIKEVIASIFFIDFMYRFPQETMLVLIGLFLGFYAMMLVIQTTTIGDLVKKN
jgi:ABC-type lipoprotein export system ATPase subunit